MITPIEIQRKTFKSGIGYDRREVDTFLKEVSSGYEKLYKENIELLDKFNALNDRVQYYKTVEETLQKTLVYAERAAEDIRNAARVEAKNIQNEAKLNANKILSDATYERDGIHLKSLALVRQFEQYKAQYKQILAVQTELITSDLCNLELSDYDISEFLTKTELKGSSRSADIDKEEPFLQVKEENTNLTFEYFSPSDEVSTTEHGEIHTIEADRILDSVSIDLAEAAESVEHMEIKSMEAIKPSDHMEIESVEAAKPSDHMEIDSVEAAKPSDHMEIDSVEAAKPNKHMEIETLHLTSVETSKPDQNENLVAALSEAACSDTANHTKETEELHSIGIKKLNINQENVSKMEAKTVSPPFNFKRELTEKEEKEELAKMLKEITGNVGFSSSANESDGDKKELIINESDEDIDLEAFEFIDTEKDIM